MKSYQVLLLLAAFVLVAQSQNYFYYDIYDKNSGVSLNLKHSQLQRYAFERSPQSCSPPIDTTKPQQVYGHYWNGQVCQPCNNPYCQCDNTGKCTSCVEGFFLNEQQIDVEGTNYTWQQCYQCRIRVNDGSSGSVYNNQAYQIVNTEYPVAKTCGVIEAPQATYETISSTEKSLPYLQYMSGIIFNTSCIKEDSEGNVYQHYGSVCYYLKGCKKYTMYGRCAECRDGWYLNGSQYCSTCGDGIPRNTLWFDDIEYKYEGNVPALDSVQRCTKCHTSDNCDECADGFYRATASSYRFNFPGASSNNLHFTRVHTNFVQERPTVQDTQQWCQVCPWYPCKCTPRDDKDITSFDATKPYEFFKFLEKADAPVGFFVQEFGTDQAKCNICTVGCAQCEYNEDAESKSKCLECKTQYQDGQAIIFQFQTPNESGECVKCPPGCYDCDSEGKCLKNKCFNGYYMTEDKNCAKCNQENAARCNSKEEITQCDHGNTSTDGLIFSDARYEKTKYNNFEIYIKQDQTTDISDIQTPVPTLRDLLSEEQLEQAYFLMTTDDNKMVCKKNEYKCKVMENANGSCKECFPAFRKYTQTVGDETIVSCEQCLSIGCVYGQKFLDENKVCKCSQCQRAYNTMPDGTCQRIDNCLVAGNLIDADGSDPIKTCETCAEGYRKNENGTQCIRCLDPNCRNCDEQREVCTDCKDGFSLWNSSFDEDITEKFKRLNTVCQACEYNCKKCTNDQVKTCTQCNEGYYLLSGVCHDKPANCAKLASNDDATKRCKYCNHGYRLTRDGFCVKCISDLIGTIHCPVINCTNQSCYYSTINKTYLTFDENTNTTVPQ